MYFDHGQQLDRGCTYIMTTIWLERMIIVYVHPHYGQQQCLLQPSNTPLVDLCIHDIASSSVCLQPSNRPLVDLCIHDLASSSVCLQLLSAP